MVIAVLGMAVGLSGRIEVAAGAGSVGGAAIALFLNVKTVGSRAESGNFRRYPHFAIVLNESDSAARLIALRWLQGGDCA